MRVAQLSPFAESVPPKLYGGIERVVARLVDELGPEVTLSARGDWRSTEKLHSVWPRALRLDRSGADPSAVRSLLREAIAKRPAEFDVIHSHVDLLPLPLLSRLGVPFPTAAHSRLELPRLPDVVREFSKAGFVSVSDNQRRPLPDAKWIGSSIVIEKASAN